jgi:tRNA A-37 threonylcarbamoyl transferase component Bud32
MEAHAGSIGIDIRKRRKPRSPRLAQLRERIRRRRLQRAERAYSIRTSGISAPSIPGSEHTHLLQHRKGF